MTRVGRLIPLACAALCLCGCASLSIGSIGSSILGTAIGAAEGNQSDKDKVQQAVQVGQAFGKAAQEITPEQEYYVGRAVAATVLSTFKPFDSRKLNDYLNTLGRGLSLASTLPETFSGYHFLAMDTEEINAFGAPSGFILVSRGLLRCASSEDEVAAVLAHEIGHVSLKHGLKAISNARWTDAALKLGKFAAQNAGSQELRDLTNSFGDVIGDITKTMINSGYSRDLEKQADLEAARILHDVGYDPAALVRVLDAMKKREKPGDPGFAKTHPDPQARIDYVRQAIKGMTPAAVPTQAQLQARQARFQAARSLM
jgi:beta-barrel assembly-enhancing protease